MLDVIVLCLMMAALFVGSLVLIDVAIQIIDKVIRIGGSKDEPDDSSEDMREDYLNRRPR